MDPFAAQPSLILVLRRATSPLTGQPYGRDPRSIAKKAEAAPVTSSGIGDTSYFGPEAEFFVFDDVRFEGRMNRRRCYEIDSEEGPYVTAKRYEDGNMGHRPPIKGGYFPVPPVDSAARSARRDAVGHERHGPRGREAPPRGGAQRSTSSASSSRRWSRPPTTCRSTNTSCTTSRTSTARRRPSCRSRSRATTARACTCTSRSVRRANAAVRRQPLRRPVGDGALLHRRHHQARQGDQRLHQPDDQQLQAPDPRLRGAGAARLFGAQPLGLVPHPDTWRARRASASRCASRIPAANPYLGFAAMLMAGPRRHQEQDPSRRRDGQEPLRPAAGRAEERPDGVRLAARGARRTSTRTASSSSRATCSPTT